MVTTENHADTTKASQTNSEPSSKVPVGPQTIRSRDIVAKFVQRHTERFEGIAPRISAKEIMELQKGQKSVVLVDVRTSEEQVVSMIPGAITRADFEANILPYLNHNASTLVIPYCTVGLRSGLYCEELLKSENNKVDSSNKGRLKKGRVRNSEGIVMWTFDGDGLVKLRDTRQEAATEPAQEPSYEATHLVHVFNLLWDMAGKGYTTVFFSEIDAVWRGLHTWCETTIKVAIYGWTVIFVTTALAILHFKWVDVRPLPSMMVRILLMQAWCLVLLLCFVMWFFFVRKMLFEPQHQAPQGGAERLKAFKRFWRKELKKQVEAVESDQQSRSSYDKEKQRSSKSNKGLQTVHESPEENKQELIQNQVDQIKKLQKLETDIGSLTSSTAALAEEKQKLEKELKKDK